MLRESKIEKYLNTSIEKLGGLSLKFVSPGNSGVPDRIVLFKHQVVFVELKAPKKKPRPLQVHMFRKILNQNIPVLVIDDFQAVSDLCAKLKQGYYVTAWMDDTYDI